MKAIVFAQTGGPEVLALADVPRPDVRPGMVLVKAHAIGVNFADIRFRQGAAFPIQVLTAYHMLHRADSTGPGRTVLVHSAAGGVGLEAVSLAEAAGARVLGTVSSDAKAPLVREHGAEAVINYA